jgi:hypothetical protein
MTDDIEYLYSLNVTAKGKIVKAALTEEALVRKRALKKLEVESNIRKEAAENEANNDVRGLENLFSEPVRLSDTYVLAYFNLSEEGMYHLNFVLQNESTSEVEETSADHPPVAVDPSDNAQNEDAMEVEESLDHIVIHSPEIEKSKENESAALQSSNSKADENDPCTSRMGLALSNEDLEAQCPADAKTCPIINILAGGKCI